MTEECEGWVPIEDGVPTNDGEYLCAISAHPNKPPTIKVCHFSTVSNQFNMYPLKVLGWHIIPPITL